MNSKLKNIGKKSMAVLMVTVMFTGMIACGKPKNNTIVPGSSILPAPQKSVSEAQTNSAKDVTLTGVLTGLDTENRVMHFVDVTQGAEYEVQYSGGTDIRNKYDKIISASTMVFGDIYDVKCDKNGKATKITESDEYWSKDGITDLDFDESSRKITLGSNTYTYDNKAVVMSGDQKISIAEIVNQDSVTLHGKDNTVYSIHVDTGHGYLTFTGVDAFVGGYVSIGPKQLLGVTADMIATVQEGTYKVEIQKGNAVSSKTVKVVKGETASVDFSETAVEATKMGQVMFSVEPSGAIMSIDGTEVDYSNPVSLAYGRHKITLNAHYYDTYTDIITVNSEYKTVVIDMTSNTTSTKSGTTSSTTSGTTSSTTSSSSGTTGSYKVNVTQPEGAALYVDSAYIGIVPCSFTKTAGSKTITLSKNGYKTVSYSISIADTKSDQSYSFPDMVQEN